MTRRSQQCVVLLLLLSWPQLMHAEELDYVRDIKPVLKAKCFSCHGALKQEANLRLDTVGFMQTGGDSGPALKRGDELNSLLLSRIVAEDPADRMPPEGEPLSPDQITRLKTWLRAGASAPTDEKPQKNPAAHWAFLPLQKVDLPNGANSVDTFVDQKLNQAKLQRSSKADAVTLVRRMFFDLHGLPPTPEQIDKWVPRLDADSPRGVEELIDELLASPHYGERWAQHWLDVVRYADTHGYEVNTPRPNSWPYRDYVISAFNQDKPYDRFVFEQLAGDTVGSDAATGFLVAAAALLPGQIGKDEESKRLARQDELDEIIIGTTATFLGLTVGCARCHDHKFDPIPQEDYYAFQAFFAGVDYGDREIHDEAFQQRVAKAEHLQPEIAELRRTLSSLHPVAFSGRTIMIDDEDAGRVTLLKEKNGHGTNPKGSQRGYADDVGNAKRFGNLSRQRYTWWDNHPGEDVFTWNPSTTGRFRIWVSWGVHGSGVHTRDARYVLDLDGDLKTRGDQKPIATADQYYFVGVTKGETEKKPLWSGLLDAGVHDITEASRIVLRGGDTGTGITADVVVLQEEQSGNETPFLPQLRAPVSAKKNVERFEPVTAKFVRFTSFETTNKNRYQPCIDELEVFTAGADTKNIALATYGTMPTSSGNYGTAGQHQLKHINDGNYGNSFSWISNEKGKGWVQLQFPTAESIDRVEWGRDREGKFADRLPVRYQIEISSDGTNWKTVCGSADRVPLGSPHDATQALLRSNVGNQDVDVPALTTRLRKLENEAANLRKPKMVFAGRFRKPDETFLLNRGDPEQPTTKLAPHVLTSIGSLRLPMQTPDQKRRTTLANWIISPSNPLTARVMVNRVWQYHFGFGLVETSSDFGLNGTEPTHPKLLDRLAEEFIESGWSVKHLHRLIMSSKTYQQAASPKAEIRKLAERSDADNRLLWHFPSRRLEAEAIRDSMLHISGQLNTEMGGPGFNFFKSRGGLSGFPPVEKFTANQFKRMVYAHKIRMEPVPVFGAFDCPDAGLPTPRRSQSTTAIQALNLFNSSFVIDQATAFAEHVEKDVGQSSARQIHRAFRLALGRKASADEHAAVSKIVDEHGLATLCRALFNSSEFLFIP